MKTIQVEVTEAQEEFINAMCRELGGVRPGDLLLAEAFTGIGCLDELHLLHIIPGLNAFVVRRELPEFDIQSMNEMGVRSRPAALTPGVLELVAEPPSTKESITIQVSGELANLAAGYAVIRGQTREKYVIEALMSCVEADGGTDYYSKAPEFAKDSPAVTV